MCPALNRYVPVIFLSGESQIRKNRKRCALGLDVDKNRVTTHHLGQVGGYSANVSEPPRVNSEFQFLTTGFLHWASKLAKPDMSTVMRRAVE
jgi:hypothetical protein